MIYFIYMSSADLEMIVGRIAALPQEATEALVRTIEQIEAYYSAEEDDAPRSDFSL